MKKTFNINVAGFPFTIDDDAYTLLDDYLKTIEHAFAGNEETRELASDIESRVAELLMERTAEGSPIITADDVEVVIARVGQPEEILCEDETLSINQDSAHNFAGKEIKETVTPPPYVPPIKKKLYRDPQNAMLGGVCSGLAWYLNIDPTMVRLITVLITILSVSTCALAYLVLWIVVPEAKNPLERMQMMGEEPTVENIGRTVTDNFRDDLSPSGRSASRPTGFGSSVALFFGILAKAIVIIGVIIAIPILVALAIGFIGCIFALLMFGTSWGWTFFGETAPEWLVSSDGIPVYGVVCGIGSTLVLGIPLYLAVRKGLKKNATPITSGLRNMLIALWVAGFLIAAISAGRIINIVDRQEREWSERRHIVYDNGLEEYHEYRESTEYTDTVASEAGQETSAPSDSIRTQS